MYSFYLLSFFNKNLTSDDFYIRHSDLGRPSQTLESKLSTESQPILQFGTKLHSRRQISKMWGGVKIMIGGCLWF